MGYYTTDNAYYKGKQEDYANIKSTHPLYAENKSYEELMEELKENINQNTYERCSSIIQSIKGDSGLTDKQKEYQILLQQHEIDSMLRTSPKEYFEMLYVHEEFKLSESVKGYDNLSHGPHFSQLAGLNRGYLKHSLEELHEMNDEEVMHFFVDRCTIEGVTGFNIEHLLGYKNVVLDNIVTDPIEKLELSRNYPLFGCMVDPSKSDGCEDMTE